MEGCSAVTEHEWSADMDLRASGLSSSERTVPRLLWDLHAEGPHPVPGSVPHHVELTRCLSHFFSDNQPAFMGIVGSDAPHLVLFSTVDRFDSFNAVVGLRHDKLVQVMDESEFMASIPVEVLVILDPRFEDGKVRYRQVLR